MQVFAKLHLIILYTLYTVMHQCHEIGVFTRYVCQSFLIVTVKKLLKSVNRNQEILQK